MKIEVDDHREIVLKEVYLGVTLESNDKEILSICMRDSGFEFTYEGVLYSAQKGVVKEVVFKNMPDSNEGPTGQNNPA